MNITLKRRNTAEIDNEKVSVLSQKLSLHPKLIEVLISRGIDDEKDINKFLHPDRDGFYDPFLMKGMRETVDRLERAIAENETVVVYGDYDADGICAAAILSLYLRSRSLDVYTHIPNRVGEGYGLNVNSLEQIIESICPDLILTCDCGISGHAEVEYALDLGVDVIVTDHHEVSDKIPECIVVNPKQSDCSYPYKYLCGAGVALKLVEAMGGRDLMYEYVDLACVATIADLVPLLDENRLIVQFGLKALEKGKNIGLKQLLKSQSLNAPVTSGDIAYKIAPRINAAGRIGDAYRAFEMLISDDIDTINSIIEEVNGANAKRKLACDKLYEEALEDLQYENLIDDRAIVLSNPEWEKGITGIVAARLTNDFKRPSFIMVPSGDGYYKGTCRSIDGINVYEALSAVSSVLSEFGGHSQAAGFSIKEENIPQFKRLINEYLSGFPTEIFMPYCVYDVEIAPEDVTLDLVRQLDQLEPTGNSFTKPLFKMSASNLSVAFCKSNINHTTITLGNGLQVFAFNFYKRNHFAIGDGNKDIIVELQLNSFNNRESARGILKEISPERLYINDETAYSIAVKYTEYEPFGGAPVYSEYGESELKSVVGDNVFGTLIIGFDSENYGEFTAAFGDCNYIVRDYMFSSTPNNYSRLMIAPDFDSGPMLSAYDKIVFLDRPLSEQMISYLNSQTKARIFVPKRDNRKRFFEKLDTSRATLGKYYDYIRKSADLSASNIYSYIKSIKNRFPDVNLSQMMFAVNVFKELGLVKEEEGKYHLNIVKGEKRELADSKILRLLERLKSNGSTAEKI